MIDFILENYNLLIKLIVFISAVTGLAVYKRHKKYQSRIFIYFVLLAFFTEFIGSYTVYVSEYEFLRPVKLLLENTPFEKNYWWFGLSWELGGVLLVSYYIYRVLRKERFKKMVKFTSWSYLIVSILIIITQLDAFFDGYILSLITIGCIVIVFNTILYFIECLEDERVYELKRSFNLVVLGTLFVWWLVVAPVVFFEDYYHTSDPSYIRLRSLILFSINFIMYGVFTIAFLFCEPQDH